MERTARTPFASLTPVLAVAGAWAIGAAFWTAAGASLPGGRWLAVHLFTLGVLTNLVAGLTHHFAETLLHVPGHGPRIGRLAVLNGGALALVVGRATATLPLVASGAAVVTAVVLWLYVDLRRMRRASLTGRFAFVVRSYERACGAFVHGALLGVVLAVAGLGSGWYGAARLAHVHVNLLGWGGITLLATLVFFGPTVMRTRMAPRADANAAAALRSAPLGLTVGVLGLLATGAGDTAGLLARVVATAGLGVFAVGASEVCRDVLRAGRQARPSLATTQIRNACRWFVMAVWVDVALVAVGAEHLLEPVGVLLLTGVLLQSVLGALAHLLPRIRTAAVERDLGTAAVVHPFVFNLGVAAVVAGVATAGVAGALWTRVGWSLVGGLAVGQIAALAALGVRAPRADEQTPAAP